MKKYSFNTEMIKKMRLRELLAAIIVVVFGYFFWQATNLIISYLGFFIFLSGLQILLWVLGFRSQFLGNDVDYLNDGNFNDREHPRITFTPSSEYRKLYELSNKIEKQMKSVDLFTEIEQTWKEISSTTFEQIREPLQQLLLALEQLRVFKKTKNGTQETKEDSAKAQLLNALAMFRSQLQILAIERTIMDRQYNKHIN